MIKNALLFSIAFIAAAVAAVAVRTATHDAYHGRANAVDTPPTQPMVRTHKQLPAADAVTEPARPAPAHGSQTGVVNTICPICGMDVDPSIQPIEHNGHRVGLGCRACPPIFPRDPDRYTQAALENRVTGR